MRLIAALPLVLLAACKPPATDDYVERVEIGASQDMPSAPLESPDTEGALWADSDRPLRLVYGKPGETPLLALACERSDNSSSTVRLTRFAPADPQAQALIALIGNGHMTRLPIDAKWNGRFWLWEMELAADDPALEVLTGPRRVELTIPGAGSVALNPSQRPGQLIERCRMPGQAPLPQE
ncbi:hypothetical protein GRI43_01540 [Altererythrobacter luteolus]|uniref:Lipoprotein n=1 Tax=Pontixanthobacter luteolus TaxID=295089 RepID=A0A6I4V102_9SPHN|nr:hypothetical protein [Pontixanthobacter luteolus]MXP46074.1 hypothetical protein [Pontixanthobacter luteolus]